MLLKRILALEMDFMKENQYTHDPTKEHLITWRYRVVEPVVVVDRSTMPTPKRASLNKSGKKATLKKKTLIGDCTIAFYMADYPNSATTC